MEISETISPPERKENPLFDRLMTAYQNSDMVRSLRLLLESLRKKSEQESLYDRLNLSRAVKRFDESEQNYLLTQVSEALTLEECLRNTTDFREGRSRILETLYKGQNQLYLAQLEIVNDRLGFSDDDIIDMTTIIREKLGFPLGGTNGKSIIDLDRIISSSRPKEQGKVLSSGRNRKEFVLGKADDEYMDGQIRRASNRLVLIKASKMYKYFDLREAINQLENNAYMVLRRLESLSEPSTFKRLVQNGYGVLETIVGHLNSITVIKNIRLPKYDLGSALQRLQNRLSNAFYRPQEPTKESTETEVRENRISFLSSLKHINPKDFIPKIKLPNYDLGGALQRLQSSFSSAFSGLQESRFRELAVNYAPTVLGVAALFAGGFVLYQFMGFQTDTSFIGTAQAQIGFLREQYSGLEVQLKMPGIQNLSEALQTANQNMVNLDNAVSEFQTIGSGESFSSSAKKLLIELNPNGVSNQQVVDAVADSTKASGYRTPKQFDYMFPENAWKPGGSSFLENIKGNPHLVYAGQKIELGDLLSNVVGNARYLIEAGVRGAQLAYDAALETTRDLRSQLTGLSNQILSKQQEITELKPKIDYRSLLTDTSTIIAAASSTILLGLGSIFSIHKENGFLYNALAKLRN